MISSKTSLIGAATTLTIKLLAVIADAFLNQPVAPLTNPEPKYVNGAEIKAFFKKC